MEIRHIRYSYGLRYIFTAADAFSPPAELAAHIRHIYAIIAGNNLLWLDEDVPPSGWCASMLIGDVFILGQQHLGEIIGARLRGHYLGDFVRHYREALRAR